MYHPHDNLVHVHHAVLSKHSALPAHQGPVKCVASAGNWIVSGGADDQLHLYSITGKDHGFLVNPGEGAVTAVTLWSPPECSDPTHMVSGSADGSLHVWNVGLGSFEHMRPLRGHKGAVNAVQLHPSGRVALSVSRDHHLRLWDMVKGRSTYTARTDGGEEALTVDFLGSGDAYLTSSFSRLALTDVITGVATSFMPPEGNRKVSAAGVAGEHLVVAGLTDGQVLVWDSRVGKDQPPQATISMGGGRTQARVRGVVEVSTQGSQTWLGTASSDGYLRLLDLRGGKDGAVVASADTGGARLTSLCVADPQRKQGSSTTTVGGGGRAGRGPGSSSSSIKSATASTSQPKSRPGGDGGHRGMRIPGGDEVGPGKGKSKSQGVGASVSVSVGEGKGKGKSTATVTGKAVLGAQRVEERASVWGSEKLKGGDLKGSLGVKQGLKKRKAAARKTRSKSVVEPNINT